MNNKPKGFFAYSNDARISETIGNFVEKVNNSGVAHIETWEEMRIGGKLLISEICKKIDNCDFFCADITRLNPNVLFEVGYAIARKKRIWLIRDSSFKSDNGDFQRFKILTTLGYRDYLSSHDILSSFYKDLPYETLDETVYDQLIEPSINYLKNENIFYLKSYYVDEASVKVTQSLEGHTAKARLTLVIDDPEEGSPQPLNWYASNVNSSRGVICHLTHYDRLDSRIQNAKHSLIAGIAYGFDVPILLLIDSDPLGPTDYRDLLFSYSRTKEALSRMDLFLLPIIDEKRQGRHAEHVEKAKNRNIEQLAMLRVGEPIAEHEDDILTDAGFVETPAYLAGLDGSQSIFVGRKGVGKTANFKKLSATFQKDKRNIVCEIKPLSYELESLVEVAKRFEQIAKKGYLFEALWKFLIFTEIARVVKAIIINRPSGDIFDNERDLIRMIAEEKILVDLDFSARLDNLSKILLSVEEVASSERDLQISVSERLHAKLIPKLTNALCKAIKGKQQLVVLIDNLDKAWDRSENSKFLSYFFLGLLSALRRVGEDFKNRPDQSESVRFTVCTFVRADIFQMVLEQAREPDKVSFFTLRWDDPAQLIHLANCRLKVAAGLQDVDVPIKSVWTKFFQTEVFGTDIFSYILSIILPRPRDLLFFLRASILAAVTRRNDKVQEQDLIRAEEDYSNFAYQSMLVELRESLPKVENILEDFMGMKSVMDIDHVFEILKKYSSGAISEIYISQQFALSSFFEIDIPNKGFVLMKSDKEYTRFLKASSNLAKNNGNAVRFRIHRAFHAALLIDSIS